MKRFVSISTFFAAVAVATVAIIAYQSRATWSGWWDGSRSPTPTESTAAMPIAEPKVLKLTSQARRNLGLISKVAKPQTYWRTIQVPGVISDRPGRSDRGVTSPAVGVVTEIHAFPGDTVQPSGRLFTLRPFSEYLQNTQAELFKAQRESQLIAEQKARLQNAAANGAISESRLIDLDNQARRQAAAIQSYRQDLLTRGLTPPQVDSVAEGRFITTIDVFAPNIDAQSTSGDVAVVKTSESSSEPPAYEVQQLNVELGQQVQAGQLLSTLANHSQLFIEGHAFKKEASLLARVAQERTEVKVEFTEDDLANWPSPIERLEIHHLANSIDPVTRTFSFFLPLKNQSRVYEKDGQSFVVWRFRPGQRVRLQIPVEELSNVLVLPAAGVVREGPEAYVFQQNGDLFTRIAVNVLYEDRLHAVIANDLSVIPGLYLAQGSAASLNRVLKSQAASGVRADVHVHADGTVHAAH